eukprot:Hpha_TRINITY_DN11322_c0_g1::TRINITY_DN11322_c0_g1_i1::g.63139::m.63139
MKNSVMTFALALGVVGGVTATGPTPIQNATPKQVGEGGVVYMSNQGVHSVLLDGRHERDLADYTCFDCAGAVVAAPLPLEDPSWYFYWTDTDTNKLIKVYRTALEPPGGGKGTPEVVCQITAQSWASGLTVDFQKDPSWVYFTALRRRDTGEIAWQIYKCLAGKAGIASPAVEAQPYLLLKTLHELGGMLAFSPSHSTIYMVVMQGNEVTIMQTDSTQDGGNGKIFGSVSRNTMVVVAEDVQSAAGIAVCGDRSYVQTVGLNAQLGAVAWATSDPKESRAAPLGVLADEMTPAIPFMQRPRTASDVRVQPPNMGCAEDAPGWLIFADESGHVKGLQVEQDITVDIYTPKTAAGGTGPLTWYFRMTQAPTISPTFQPSTPPTLGPTTLYPPPSDAPTTQPSTSVPSSPPELGPQPTGTPVVLPSLSPLPVPTASPQNRTESPSTAPSPPPTFPPTRNETLYLVPEEAAEESDPVIGILIGVGVAVVCCIGWSIVVWRMKKGMKKETPPEDMSIERDLVAKEDKTMAFTEGDEVRIVADGPAVHAAIKAAGLPPLGDQKVGQNCIVKAVDHDRIFYTVTFPDGTSATVPESCVSYRLPTPDPEPEEKPHQWEVGDRCEEFVDTVDLKEECEKMGCKYAPEMESIVGRGGEVVEVHARKNLCRVKFDDGTQWVVPGTVLRKPTDGGGWFLGDTAQVTPSPQELERLCRDSPGGWVPAMDTLPGAIVKVLEVKPKSHEVRIGIEGQPHHYVVPSAALQKPNASNLSVCRVASISSPLVPSKNEGRATPVYTHGLQYSARGDSKGDTPSKWVSIGVPSSSLRSTNTPQGSFSPSLEVTGFPPRSPRSPRVRPPRDATQTVPLAKHDRGDISPPNRAGSLRITKPSIRQGSHHTRGDRKASISGDVAN